MRELVTFFIFLFFIFIINTAVFDTCNYIENINFDYKNSLSIIGATEKTVDVAGNHSIFNVGFFFFINI